MKRSRTSSKSAEGVVPSSKDEPPKKVAKKRIKSSTQSSPQSASQSSSSVPTPFIVKPSKAPNSATKLGSLPMYGEELPDNGHAAIPKWAKNTCDNLRLIMGKIRELKSNEAETEIELHKQKGLVHFVTLKKLNRLSHMYCKDTREQTHEQKLGVDDLHLQLQNLMYEAMHLRKEITNCLEFKSQHEEIDLISEDEVFSASEMPVDEHQRMLRRLESELEQRKQLAEQRSNLESAIAKEEADILIKEENLNNILPTLEGIRKATLPLQESLGIPLDKKKEEQELALLLPSSLYIFYMQAKAYSEVQDSSLAVSVVGDMGEAKSLQGSQQDNSEEESGDSDGEGGEKEQRKKTRKRDKASLEKKISKAHPLSIICTITLKDLGSFQVTFSYLPHFSVVCASVSFVSVSGVSEDQLSTLLDKSCLLHCLTDGDTGRTSPNSIVSFHIRKHGNEVFSSAVRTYGFPYKWIQRVCGISDNAEMPDSTPPEQQVEISAENMDSVISKLKLRFQTQVYLLRQVISLSCEGSELILGPDSDALLSGRPYCKLVKWKQLSLTEFQLSSSQFVSHSIFNLQERMNKFYLGTFQHNKANLKCLICIGSDYPYTAPAIAIMIEDFGGKEVDDVQIKNIEADVNVRFPESVKDSDKLGQYLLCRQVLRLQKCFDTYMDYRMSTDTGTKIRGKGRLLVLDKF